MLIRDSSTSNPDADKPVLALKNISLTIRAGEKIAICGRTGRCIYSSPIIPISFPLTPPSGKSSLILLLLRLLNAEPTPGLTYTIDSLDILTVNRTHLRSAIIAVPQECVFLPDDSSIRSNIDPSNTISSTECAEILDMVRLTPFVAAAGGLDAPMSGDQLSAGQQQLFSLGRAVYRRRARMRAAGRDGGVLLLDEISSSVDWETEVLMHGVIRKEFDAYTVVAVAHRLQLMVEFVDRVVVLDQGRVVEVGRGSELLEKEEGWFRRLYLAGQ